MKWRYWQRLDLKQPDITEALQLKIPTKADLSTAG
jgi:hypothetical protein